MQIASSLASRQSSTNEYLWSFYWWDLRQKEVCCLADLLRPLREAFDAIYYHILLNKRFGVATWKQHFPNGPTFLEAYLKKNDVEILALQISMLLKLNCLEESTNNTLLAHSFISWEGRGRESLPAILLIPGDLKGNLSNNKEVVCYNLLSWQTCFKTAYSSYSHSFSLILISFINVS